MAGRMASANEGEETILILDTVTAYVAHQRVNPLNVEESRSPLQIEEALWCGDKSLFL